MMISCSSPTHCYKKRTVEDTFSPALFRPFETIQCKDRALPVSPLQQDTTSMQDYSHEIPRDRGDA